MSEVSSWSTTAASNNSASPDGFPEAMAPSGVNDSARELMAAIKRWRDDISCTVTAGGTANAITVAAAQTISAYAAGQVFSFIAASANTGAVTLNVDSVGAKAVKKHHDVALSANDIESGQLVVVAYRATEDVFQMLSPTAAEHYRNVNNLTAAPGVGDDTADGYQPGSIAVDVTNDKAYICVDASAGAAIWQQASNVVLQVVHDTDGGSSHSNTSYANLNGATVSITPKSATSKLLIEVSARLRVNNVSAVNAVATFSIYESSAGTALSNEYTVEAFSASGGIGVAVPGVIRVQVDSSGTTARTFGLQGKVNNGSSTVTGSLMVWTITEYLA